MSAAPEIEMTAASLAAPEAGSQESTNSAVPAPPPNPDVARFRKGFYTDSEFGLLMTMGEEPSEYLALLEPMLAELEPSEGLEFQLVEQMAQALWRLRRTQHMLDGLGVKRLQKKLEFERRSAAILCSQAFSVLEPFEALLNALAPRKEGPTAAEIDVFVQHRAKDNSPEMREFIVRLKSLNQPMETRERNSVRRKARIELQGLMDNYESIAWQNSRKFEKLESRENLAALMAPEDAQGMQLYRLEDACLRRFTLLTKALEKLRKGALHKKMKKNDEQSRNVYENKQKVDNLPDEKSDTRVAKIQNMEASAA